MKKRGAQRFQNLRMTSFYDQTFSQHTQLECGEYEQCQFKGCALAEADLSGCKFIDCDFTECDLSLAKIGQTAFQEVRFRGCKMLGLRFDRSNPFGLALSFERCLLNHSSFYQCKLKYTRFVGCQLQEVDLVEADLTSALFEACNLLGATFERTNLEKADLRTAYQLALEPENNRLKGAKFSLDGLPGLLLKYQLDLGQ